MVTKCDIERPDHACFVTPRIYGSVRSLCDRNGQQFSALSWTQPNYEVETSLRIFLASFVETYLQDNMLVWRKPRGLNFRVDYRATHEEFSFIAAKGTHNLLNVNFTTCASVMITNRAISNQENISHITSDEIGVHIYGRTVLDGPSANDEMGAILHAKVSQNQTERKDLDRGTTNTFLAQTMHFCI